MTSGALIRARAYAVHLLTASGIVAAFFAVAEPLDNAPIERVVFARLIVAVRIDAVDGPLARAGKRSASLRTSTGGPSTTSSIISCSRSSRSSSSGAWAGYRSRRFLRVRRASFRRYWRVRSGSPMWRPWMRLRYFRGFPSDWNIAAFYAGLASHGLGQPGSGSMGQSAGAGRADRRTPAPST